MLTVTEQHIKDGVPGCPSKCPIALSMLAAGYRDVYIGDTELHYWSGTDMVRQLTLPMRSFVSSFDQRSAVIPFEFELNDLVRIM